MKKEVVEYLKKIFPELSKRKLSRLYDLLLLNLSQSVREGKPTFVKYFGRFQRKFKDGVIYYNPKTKQKSAKLRVWVRFKPCKHLKGKV